VSRKIDILFMKNYWLIQLRRLRGE